MTARDPHRRGDFVGGAWEADGKRAALSDAGVPGVQRELEGLDARAVGTQRGLQIGQKGVSGSDAGSLPTGVHHDSPGPSY